MQTETNKASKTKSAARAGRWGRLDPDSILRDLLHQWWMVALSALAGALLMGASALYNYSPTYTSTTIFAIGTTGYTYSSSRIYANYSQASTTTSQFSQVISSSILRRQVCENLGISSLNAQISVSTVSSTNLMVLTVTAASPKEAYQISCAVKEESVELMDYFLDDVTLMEIQKTNVPDTEASPLNLVYYMRRGFLAGAGGMLILLILLSYLRGTVKNRNDVAALVDAKLLGTIGYEKKGQAGSAGGKLSRKARREELKKESLLINNPMRSFNYVESCRMLASGIRIALDQADRKVLMVTSTAENEGKTTVAANIALAMSQEGKRVLLVDLDFRKPAVYKVFEQENLEGRDFCESLMQGTTVRFSHVEGVPNLLLLLSKKAISGSWGKDKMTAIARTIELVKSRVDYIILDTPPLELVSDGEEYAALADACVMIIREDMVYATIINDAIDSLNEAGVDVMGCVLNASRGGFVKRITHSDNHGASNYGNYSHYGTT